MNHGVDSNDHINLDLSLRIGPREEDSVEEQNPFMQFLISESNSPPHTLQPSPPPTSICDLTLALFPIPQMENNSVEALSPSPQLNQFFPSMQPEALETSSTRPMLFQPRVENVSLETLFEIPSTEPQPPVEKYGSFPAHQQFYHQRFLPLQSESLDTPNIQLRFGRPPANNQARPKSVAGNKKQSDKEIVAPYPWMTTKPAVVYNLRYLSSKYINVIFGDIQCKPCTKSITLEYNLMEKFAELSRYIDEKERGMRKRASDIWMNPKLTPCESCKSGMKPVISNSMEKINWLFLFLGQMLGCCTLGQLKYFCGITKQHQTGAKDRLVYQIYLTLYKQLKSD